MFKVVLIHHGNINPLRLPLFNSINEQIRKNNIDFYVIYVGKSFKNKKWNTNRRLITHKYYVVEKSLSVVPILFNIKPDVIIGSYGFLAGWIGIFYKLLYRKKYILWSGSWMETTNHKKDFIEKMKNFYISNCNSFITYGTKPAEYLEYLGAVKEKIFIGNNVADTKFYVESVNKIRNSKEFYKIRKSYPKIVFLFAGQLIERKGIINLICSLSKLSQIENWQIFIAGDGKLKDKIKKLVNEYNLKEKVKILGFVDREELAKFFALSDVFILPSLSDPFSLVLSEAISSGLYVISSKFDGASYDFVKENINGNVVDPNDINELTNVINKVINNFDSLPSREMISNSISHLTIERYAIKICESILFALKN